MEKELYTIESYPAKKIPLMKTKPHRQKLKTIKKIDAKVKLENVFK